MSPKVSIVTIAYNCESEIEETILSVIGQDYPNKEYIIIDGASTDGTMRVVEKYIDAVDVIISEPDRGRSDAFNKGIAVSTGDYILMMNAGDLLVEGALSAFARSFVPGYDVIKGNTIRWDAETGYKSVEYPVAVYRQVPLKFHASHQSSFISKDAYIKWGGYEEKLHVAMDFELMLRFTKNNAKFYLVDENIAVFRMGGISQKAGKRRLEEMEYAMRKNGHCRFHTIVFVLYIRLRTSLRKILDFINPNLKNRIVTETVK